MNADELFDIINILPEDKKINVFSFLYGMMKIKMEQWEITQLNKFIMAITAKEEKYESINYKRFLASREN